MKKRICLLITLIVSLFVFSGRVEAAKKLSCVYNGKYMLVQDSSGTQKLYFQITGGKHSAADEGWNQYPRYTIVFDSKYYDSNTKELSDCPKYNYDRGLHNETVFSDKKGVNDLGIERVTNRELSESVFDSDVEKTFGIPSLYQEQIKNTKWLGKCVYGYNDKSKLELYFNDDDYIIANYFSSNTRAKFKNSELLKVVKDGKTCPPYIYMYTAITQTTSITGITSSRSDEIYLFKKDIVGLGGVTVAGTTFTKTELPCIEGKVDIDFGNIENPTLPPIDDCKDLFGDDLVKQINKVMDVIKIAIPILLIGLGVLDFTKAVFAGNDDEMAKSKKTFFNRIIAAILVFIAPIFVNLILSLANNVWGYISPDTCISQKK